MINDPWSLKLRIIDSGRPTQTIYLQVTYNLQYTHLTAIIITPDNSHDIQQAIATTLKTIMIMLVKTKLLIKFYSVLL